MSTYAERTLIVLNPAAGQEDPTRLRRLLGGAFAVRGASFDLVETTGGGDAERYAAEAVRLGYRACVAVGGDGTVAEVISGLAGSEVPLAIVPQGTGNQLASNVGVPLELEAAVEVAVHGTPTAIDVGRLDNGSHFALMAGAGWDAEVISVASRELKDRWGFGAYLYAGFRTSIAPRTARFRITTEEGSIEVEAATVILANAAQLVNPYLPLDLRIAPGGSIFDGKMDVCVFAPRNLSDVAAVLWKVASGRYGGDERMIYLQASEVTLESDPPMAAQMDGELIGDTPLSARIVPGGVKVLIPAV